MGEISESLRPELQEVQFSRLGRPSVKHAWMISVWIPPNAMLLMSSMIGETLERCQAGEMPIVLVEGLSFDGNAEFFCGTMSLGIEDLHKFSSIALEQALAASVLLNAESGQLYLHTNVAGRNALEALIQSRGDTCKIEWTALGGNQEYFSWIASELATAGAAPADAA